MDDQLVRWRQRVDQAIENIIPRQIDEEYLATFFGQPHYSYQPEAVQQSLADPVWDLLDSGGKRWRAILLLLIVDALGEDPHEFLSYACIPEILHNGTIIVDDIEDSARVRRGDPAVHHQYGVDIALNAGNALYFIPLNIIARNEADLSAEQRLQAYEMLSYEFNRTHIGQGMDIRWHNQREVAVSELQYFEMCACKTGCLARIVARLAAIITGQPNDVEMQLAQYAEEMSISFQIADDMLDIEHTLDQAGDFGKEFGNDIREGKKTLLVIYTAEHAPQDAVERLEEILWKDGNTDEEIREAINIMQSVDAFAYAREHAEELAADARSRLDGLDLEPEPEEQLKDFTRFVIDRRT
jgi:geranylgeranyl diphosphate synthase type I